MEFTFVLNVNELIRLSSLTNFIIQSILRAEPCFIVADGNCTRSADNAVSVLFNLNQDDLTELAKRSNFHCNVTSPV